MYLPVILMSIVYALRGLGVYFSFLPLQTKKFLIFIQGMFALILLVGAFKGYQRWEMLKVHGEVAEAEIIYKGQCTDYLYKEGKHRQAYKRIVETSANNKSAPDLKEPDADKIGSPCLGYRFLNAEKNKLVYANEHVPLADWDGLEVGDNITVRYEANYLPNNFLEDYIADTQRDSIYHAWIFGFILAETLVSSFFLMKRENRPPQK